LLKITTQFTSQGYETHYGSTDEKEAKINIQFKIEQTELVILALERILEYLKEQPEVQQTKSKGSVHNV